MCDIVEAVTEELRRHLFCPPTLMDRPLTPRALARVRLAMCDGKRTFNDKDTAKRAGKKARANGQGCVRPYRCPFCSNEAGERWHLGGKHGNSQEQYERLRSRVEVTLARPDA